MHPPGPSCALACMQRGKACGQGGVHELGGGGWRSLAKGDWDGHTVPLVPTGMCTKRACGVGHIKGGGGPGIALTEGTGGALSLLCPLACRGGCQAGWGG